MTGREEVAEGTTAFHLSKPSGFRFKPGQAINLALIDPPSEPNSAQRTFSLACAPFEEDLVVATRMREGSAFKRALRALPPGAKVRIRSPFGSFALHPDVARPAVLIAGGIGITPFMSMLRQEAKDHSPRRLVLVYSNRRPQDSAFLGELQALERQNANFRLLAVMTDTTGFVDADLLKRAAAGLTSPVYYVVGPPAMAAAMQETLGQVGIAEDDIRSEEFYGY